MALGSLVAQVFPSCGRPEAFVLSGENPQVRASAANPIGPVAMAFPLRPRHSLEQSAHFHTLIGHEVPTLLFSTLRYFMPGGVGYRVHELAFCSAQFGETIRPGSDNDAWPTIPKNTPEPESTPGSQTGDLAQPVSRLYHHDALSGIHLSLPKDRSARLRHHHHRYQPRGNALSSRHLKLYLLAYRNLGIFYENAVNRILRDIVAATRPVWCTVRGEFTPRGGLTTTVEARWPGSGATADWPVAVTANDVDNPSRLRDNPILECRRRPRRLSTSEEIVTMSITPNVPHPGR